MFEQTFLGRGARTQSAWTVVVSFLGQTLGIGIITLVPLIATDTLPRAQFTRIFTAPPVPPPPPPPAPQAVKAASMAVHVSQVVSGGLVMPARVPQKPAVILEDPVPAIQASEAGVPGGTGVPGGMRGGVLEGVISSVLTQAPVAPPPAPVAPQTSAPARVTRLVVGGNVQAARLIHQPSLLYPPLARQARISGVVRLEGIISRDGAIQRLRVISGHPLLVPSALECVKRFVYRPTLLNGEPVEVIAPIEVIFTLN